ncbi:MAG: peptide-methionine (S)-S-oxide reductase MsrA [Pseudomonadota bacterium]
MHTDRVTRYESTRHSMRNPALTARTGLLAALALMLAACANEPTPAAPAGPDTPSAAPDGTAIAIFAGGCFWCMEPPFDALDGVLSTVSGYTDGATENPIYKQVSAGVTGHTEAVQITYDPARVSYETLLKVFWKNVDPFAVDRQFCDRGTQYRSGIYVMDATEQALAEASAARVRDQFDREVATEIKPATRFYAAEDYHQDYYLKNPIRYKFYRRGCGRDKRLEELWGPSEKS